MVNHSCQLRIPQEISLTERRPYLMIHSHPYDFFFRDMPEVYNACYVYIRKYVQQSDGTVHICKNVCI